jgi:hypothetical protein
VYVIDRTNSPQKERAIRLVSRTVRKASTNVLLKRSHIPLTAIVALHLELHKQANAYVKERPRMNN